MNFAEQLAFLSDDNSPEAVVKRLTDNSVTSNEWRKYGEKRRAEILEKEVMHLSDNAAFAVLDENYPVKSYFRLSERVVKQFNVLYETGKNDEYAYIIGNRLVTFLMYTLPKHPGYMSSSTHKLRNKNLFNLLVIKRRLESLSQRIDEEQLNLHVMDNYNPFADDDGEDNNYHEILDFNGNNVFTFGSSYDYELDCVKKIDASSYISNLTEETEAVKSFSEGSSQGDFSKKKLRTPSLSYSVESGNSSCNNTSSSREKEEINFFRNSSLAPASETSGSRSDWEDFQSWPFQVDVKDRTGTKHKNGNGKVKHKYIVETVYSSSSDSGYSIDASLEKGQKFVETDFDPFHLG